MIGILKTMAKMNNQQLSTASCNVCGATHRDIGEIEEGKFYPIDNRIEFETEKLPISVFLAVLKRDKAKGVYLCQKHDNRSQMAKMYRKAAKEKKLNNFKLL